MSHQGNPGWFPDCIDCGMGNLPHVICLDPFHSPGEAGGDPELEKLCRHIDTKNSLENKFLEEEEHYWTVCLLCPTKMVSDPEAWGSKGLCADCYNNRLNKTTSGKNWWEKWKK